MSTKKTTYNSKRNVTNEQINKSYKGILRIAPIYDVNDITEDNYDNEELYGEDTQTLSSTKGYLSAYPGLIGNTIRYSFPNDELKNCRLPVTDSAGNYLNWNVGLNGVTIGDDKIKYPEDYTILRADNIFVGLEKNKANKDTTSEKGGTVQIDSELIINNANFCSPNKLKNDDSLLFRQNNDNKVTYENIDSFIDDFLSKVYKNQFIKQVPSGSVIYHASSLRQWRTDNPYDENDKAMQQGTNEILIQGTYRKNKYNSPKYKRDYLLCDGSVYKLTYVPKNFSIRGDILENRERFFELFFNLGYAYTERKHLANRLQSIYSKDYYRYVPILSDEKTQITKTVEWENINVNDLTKLTNHNFGPYVEKTNTKLYPKYLKVTDSAYDKLDDVDVLFQEDLVTMLACDAVYDFVRSYQNNNSGKLPSDYEINNMLEGTSIPENFIFNSFIHDSKGQAKWALPEGVSDKSIQDVIEIPYQDESEKVTILLGKEINKFGQLIKFYSPSESSYKQCKIWRLPLVTLFKRVLLAGVTDKDLLPYLHSFYSYNFQVPKLIADDYTPTFIGSGAYMLTKNHCKNMNKVQSWSGVTNKNTIIPHRHYIALSETNSDGKYISFNDIQSGSYPFSNSMDNYILEPLNKNNMLVAEYCDYTINSSIPDIYNNSYILGDISSNLTNTSRYGDINTFVSDSIPEPNRGLSGEAIFTEESLGNTKNDENKTNFPNSTSKYFFSMENITYLPLIKI